MTEAGKGKKTLAKAVICGAGAAGLGASIAAAGAGFDVTLIERESYVGGTVVKANLHTLAGFFDLNGGVIESGICREFIARADERALKRKMGRYWVLQISRAHYRQVVSDWMAEFENLKLALNSAVPDLVMMDGRAHSEAFPGQYFIDATGNAELISILKGELTERSENSYALTFQVTLQNPPHLDLATRVSLKAELERANLRGSIWLDTGHSANELFVKANFSSLADAEAAASPLTAAINSLKRLGEVQSIERSEICDRGGLRLKARDLKPQAGRCFQVAWPYEYWRGADVQLEQPPRMPFYLSEDHFRVPGVSNLFAIGKSAGIPMPQMSAARVVGSCWTMGEQLVKMMVREAT